MEYGNGYYLTTRIVSFLGRAVFRFRRTELDYMLSFMKDNGSKVLDFGCNSGYFAALVKRKYPSCRVYGADINEFALKYARKKHKNIRFYKADNNFFKNKKFDVIILSHVLEHICERDGLIRKLTDILSKNGKLVITVPQERVRGDTNLFQIMFNVCCGRFSNPHIVNLRYDGIKEILDKSGLKIIDKTYTNSFAFIPFKSKSKNIFSWSLVVAAVKN